MQEIGKNEVKNKRVNLVLYPSLYDTLVRLQSAVLLDETGKPIHKSFNDLIDYLGRRFIEEHKEDLEAHQKFIDSLKK